MPEDEPIEHPADVPASTDSAPESHAPEISMEQPALRGIAPLWHTLVLVLAILAYSVWGAVGAHSGVSNSAAPPSGAAQSQTHGADHGRLIRYALTGALELALVLWVAFGLRLRKIPFRSLFGVWPKGLNGITMEILIAAAFWVCSMIILLVFALSWFAVQNRIYNHETARQPAASSQSSVKPESPEQKQTELIKQLTELAPANGLEIAAWGVLCLVVGFSEELIFRGYLQVQGIALLRNLPLGVLVTAIVFGAAHGYQGVRGMFLISIYGSLFGILTLLRRNLFPGMLAHSWHDFLMGLLLALVRAEPQLLEHSLNAPK
jgi:membrane protease YdiL (CAAX protease family)